jgi:cell division ATPase FtsA
MDEPEGNKQYLKERRVGKESNLIVGLDIGTTKVCAIVGESIYPNGMDIIGVGTYPSFGSRSKY